MGEDGEQQDLSNKRVELQTCIAILEGSLVISYKAKHSFTIQSSKCTSRYLPNWDENVCPHKTLQITAVSSIIHHCPKLEANKMSFNRWMDKQTVVKPYNSILLSNKKKWATKLQKDMKKP